MVEIKNQMWEKAVVGGKRIVAVVWKHRNQAGVRIVALAV
jgi:hypothetical protein